LRVGADNEVFAIDFQGDTIYRLRGDGTLEEYMRFPGSVIDYFNIAPDGTFWFVDNRDWGLYHVVNRGDKQLIATEMNRLFVFDSKGNLIAVDQSSNNVQKISPDGKVEILASGFQSLRIAVGPDDSIFLVTFNGELARVNTDGTLTILATGLGIEDSPAFAPDGTMYLLGWNGLQKINPLTGTKEKLAWYSRYENIGGGLVIDKKGVGYIFHPNMPLYRMNLQAQTLDVVYSPNGNSWAMSVNPLTEEVFVAYGDQLPGGKTILFRVKEDGGLEEFGKVPYGMEIAIAFSSSGIGYLSVTDKEKGSMIYTFRPQDGTLKEFQQTNCVAQGIAVDPKTNILWWTDCNTLVHFTDEVGMQTIPYLEDVNNSSIAFGADGTLYALAWIRAQAPNLPMPHGIYRFDGGKWARIKDLTAKHPSITLAELAVCPDNHIYIAGSIDGETIGRVDPIMSSLLRLESDSSLTLLGYDLGFFDPLAIACSPSGGVYFTNAQGIYRIPQLGVKK
jgi:sugar lactone lactonase YvrE